MVDIKISVPGINEARKAFAAFPEIVGPHLRNASMKSAFVIEGNAKKLSPVDTGRMRASIATSLGIKDKGITSIVQTNVKYAIYVHEGTKYQKAQPFMKRGADQSRSKIGDIYESEINQALKKVASMAQ